MEEVRGRKFVAGEAVETDGKAFIDCHFESTRLRYAGGTHPTFANCTFGPTEWLFEGAALQTVQLLQMIRNSPGGDLFFAHVFQPGKVFDDL